MRILILTSKDHIYANLLLKTLLQSGVFDQDELHVWEQTSVVPRKSFFKGLSMYVRTAGFRYVFVQAMKQYLFKCIRFVASMRGNETSLFYPYDKLDHPNLQKETYEHLWRDEAYERIKTLAPDMILSAYSKEIITPRILEIAPQNLNVHPAYLPAHRGISPTFWCLANGDTTTGATVHELDATIDTGKILARKKISIAPSKTEHDLYVRLTILAASMVEKILRNESIESDQDMRQDSYFSLPTKNAVKQFYKNGYSFFSVGEFLRPKNIEKI